MQQKISNSPSITPKFIYNYLRSLFNWNIQILKNEIETNNNNKKKREQLYLLYGKN
jgi:hypothetical protein